MEDNNACSENLSKSIFKITEKKRRTLDIYIDSRVLQPSYYRETIDAINSLTSDDTINIYLNTEGGAVSSGVALFTAIRQSPAKKVSIVHMAFSCGSFLMMATDEIHLSRYSRIMIHNMRGGTSGKIQDMINELSFHNDFFYDTYKNVLTDEEMIKFKSGVDLWFNASDIAPRLEKIGKKVVWMNI